jgi:uncharacterized membrane protein
MHDQNVCQWVSINLKFDERLNKLDCVTIDFSCSPYAILLLNPSFFWQNGLATKVEKSRKQMKERKNRTKKIRGVKKVSLLGLQFLYTLCDNASSALLMQALLILLIHSQTKAGDAKKK